MRQMFEGKHFSKTRSYASNLKWILKSNPKILSEIQNRAELFAFFLQPYKKDCLTIAFRNGERLLVPSDYAFEAVAETVLMNIYRFEVPSTPTVVVDIGASIGDFALLASRFPQTHVYAVEPNVPAFGYLEKNMALNHRKLVRSFNSFADSNTLVSISKQAGQRIHFLKIDCEGSEYELLMNCPHSVLSTVNQIA